MASKRDGRSLTDLAVFCDEMQQHVRALTKSLRAESAHRGDGRPGTPTPSSNIVRSMRSVSAALQELVSVLPSVPVIEGENGSIDPRILTLGLMSQWLDRDGEIAHKARRGIHGHSDSIELSSVVELIAVQRKSGLLRVRSAMETFLLEFEDGDVVHAVSDNSPNRDRLGEILVDQGALDRDILRDLLMKYRDSRRRLGNHFEIQQLVGEEGLRRALEEQVQRLFHRLFAAKDAYFEFIEDVANEHMQKVRMGAMSLLLESAHVIDTQRDAQSNLSGNIDLDEILSDDEQRMKIVANAVQASTTDTTASDPALAAAGHEDATSTATADGDTNADGSPQDAVSFLKQYGIGTKKWLAEMPKPNAAKVEASESDSAEGADASVDESADEPSDG